MCWGHCHGWEQMALGTGMGEGAWDLPQHLARMCTVGSGEEA